MDKREKKQLKDVQTDYPHPAVTNDVIKTEYEAYPGRLENAQEADTLDDVEESVVKHTTDGKTWHSSADTE